mgnify:CR=1 FL=1
MISSIVLAAGTSSRMAGNPKALLDWGGQPLVAYQVEQLREAGADEVIVVLGHRGDEIHRKIARLPCRVMLNTRYFAGRAGSLRIGARAVNRDAERIVVVNVDQPRPAGLTRRLLDAHDAASAATRPEFEGRRGHPVVVSGWLRNEMLAARDEDDGLRGILHRYPERLAELAAGPECLLDINTPEEYERARMEASEARA